MPDLVSIGVAVTVFGVLVYLKRADVSGARAHELVSKGAQLVDVRSPGEYASGHLDGARNIPVSDVSRRSGELDRARPVIVYCASGTRSAMAKRALRSAGFAEVYNLGSIRNW